MIVYVKFGTRHAYNKPQESPEEPRRDGDGDRVAAKSMQHISQFEADGEKDKTGPRERPLSHAHAALKSVTVSQSHRVTGSGGTLPEVTPRRS